MTSTSPRLPRQPAATKLAPLLAALLLAAAPSTPAALTASGSVTDLDGNPWPQSGHLAIGYSGDATMQLINGGSVTQVNPGDTYVAYGDGVTASLRVHGSGVTFKPSGNIHAGEGVNSHGSFTLGGATQLIYPTYQNHSIYLGKGVGSYGGMTITDPGTHLFLSDWLLVGHLTGARGRLVVKDGATCEASRIFIGYAAGSVGEALVRGPGSTLVGWLNEDDGIGWSGRGSLIVEDGGLAEFRNLSIGYTHGSHGEALVTGAGSRIENQNSFFNIGRGGGPSPELAEGVLKLARGGVGYSSSNFLIGNTSHSAKGTLVFILGNDGSGSIVPGHAEVAGELRLQFAFLQMEVDPGSTLSLGQQFTLVDYQAIHYSLNRFQNAPEGAILLTPNHHAFRINYATDLGAGDLAITATVVAPPTTDSDSDNLLDAWEIRCFGATDDPRADPVLDPDGDGRDTACEHAAGTDPLDPASRCVTEVTDTPVGAPWDLAYSPYDPAVTYTVERATELTGPWDPVTPTATTVDGSSVLFTLPASATEQAFYRVRIER